MTISLQKAVIIKKKNRFAGLRICVLATSCWFFKGSELYFFHTLILHCKVVVVYKIKNNDDFICFKFTRTLVFTICAAVMLSIGDSSIRRSTLGARGFSCAIFGFGQVLKSGFAARVFGVRPNTCRLTADETKLPDAREKNPWYPG